MFPKFRPWIKCLKIFLNLITYMKAQFYLSLLILSEKEGMFQPRLQFLILINFSQVPFSLPLQWSALEMPACEVLVVRAREWGRFLNWATSSRKSPKSTFFSSLPLKFFPFLVLCLFKFSKICAIIPGKDFILSLESQSSVEKMSVKCVAS